MKCLVCSLDNCQEEECAKTLASIQRLLDAMPGVGEQRLTINQDKLLEPEDLKEKQTRKDGKE